MSDLAISTPAADAPVPTSDDPNRTILAGLTLAGSFFVGFLGWAALTPLDAGAYAHGVVAVSGGRQAVQTRDGGVVIALHIVEGQTVVAGQVLVELSGSELRASERSMTGEMFSLLAERQRLIAERQQMAQVQVPIEFVDLTSEDRGLADEAMDLQRIQFQARAASLATQRSVLINQIHQLDEQTAGAQRQLEANQAQQGLNAEELVDVETLRARGYAPKTRVLALQRSAAGLVGEEGAYRSQIGKFNEAVGQTRLQILQLSRTRTEDAADRLRDIQLRLDDLRPKLSAAREQLAKAIVRAPAGGRVVGLTVFTVGGVIAPGQTVMEIVPTDRRLVIQARVSPDDADDLKPGQRTQIRFGSIHDRSLPLIDGTLTRLSADSFLDERSGQSYFQAEVAAPPEALKKINRATSGRVSLQAGLPAEILIPLQKRSALTYLLDPLLRTVWGTGREH